MPTTMGPVPPHPRTRRGRAVSGLAVLSALVAVGVGCTPERQADLRRPATTVAPEDQRDDAADQLVDGIEEALTRREPVGRVAAMVRGRTDLRTAVANVRALGLRDVQVRYLAPSTTTMSAPEDERFGPAAWLADVQVSWRQPGVDERPALLTVPMVFSGDGKDQRFVSFAPQEADHVPIWLLTRLFVVRAPHSVAVAPSPARARRLSAYAERAVATVRRTVPQWRSRLLVQEAPDQRVFQVAAGLPVEQARAVAAVTTTPDGSGDPDARGQVYVNPRLYDPLGHDGRQIVISHESAHVALGAATAQMPLWLSEGTADWIALRYSTIPMSRLASQVLGWVRSSGGPRELPGPSAFDGSDKRIGAWYEAAWLAVKRIADTYGADRLLRFYRATERAGRTDRAFPDVLGTSEGAFTRDWRASLASLA